MPMPPYPVICDSPGCDNPAEYKIAAQWSDGVTGELKTYHLACRDCLPHLFADAKYRRDRCRVAVGESLEVPGIYLLDRGARDQQLNRRIELESELASA